MPQLRRCKDLYARGGDAKLREGDYDFATVRVLRRGHLGRGYDVAKHFAGVIAKRHRTGEPDLEKNFGDLVAQWKKETGHLSSITKAIANPNYLRIIGMGKEALPLLLKELRDDPDHWLVALNAITGEDPAPEGANFSEAVAAWKEWGEARKLY